MTGQVSRKPPSTLKYIFTILVVLTSVESVTIHLNVTAAVKSLLGHKLFGFQSFEFVPSRQLHLATGQKYCHNRVASQACFITCFG